MEDRARRARIQADRFDWAESAAATWQALGDLACDDRGARCAS